LELGYPLLILSLFSAIISSALFIKKPKYAEILLYFSSSATFASFLILCAYFLTDTFSLWYVYSNSNAEMPVIFKFSAVWAGKEGSLLLWALFNLLATSFYISHGKKSKSKAKVAMVMTALSSYLLLNLVLFSNPFETLQYQPLNGVGLNPLLRTVEMVIHPPVVFLGYALASLLFAVTLFKAEYEEKVARIAWISLTAGIIIGGWWAYRTLGWGGFWGWDPVENSSLLPWLTLTAYFHVTRGREIFSYLTFTFVLFATFITRSGIISSVHAFGGEAADYSYLLPLLISIIPVALRIRTQIGSLCTQHLPTIFVSALVVVLLGTIAAVSLKVERTYYLVTFLPIFVLIALILVSKLKKIPMPAVLLHAGVLLVFLGATSVWVFESGEVVTLPDSGDLKLLNYYLEADIEKYTVTAHIKTSDTIIEPKVYIYKIERRDRVVSSVEIVSKLLWDEYYAIKDYDLKNGIFVLERYIVPMINAVWIGSALMLLAATLKLSGKVFKLRDKR